MGKKYRVRRRRGDYWREIEDWCLVTISGSFYQTFIKTNTDTKTRVRGYPKVIEVDPPGTGGDRDGDGRTVEHNIVVSKQCVDSLLGLTEGPPLHAVQPGKEAGPGIIAEGEIDEWMKLRLRRDQRREQKDFNFVFNYTFFLPVNNCEECNNLDQDYILGLNLDSWALAPVFNSDGDETDYKKKLKRALDLKADQWAKRTWNRGGWVWPPSYRKVD